MQITLKQQLAVISVLFLFLRVFLGLALQEGLELNMERTSILV